MREERPLRTFARRVWERSSDDNVFFLASGLTFSAVLAAIPFLLLLLSLPTLILGAEIERFTEEALDWLWRITPVTAPQVQDDLRAQIQSIVDSAGPIGLVSAVLFAWFSTRLFGALRTALDEVFDIEDPRGMVRGKLADFQFVLLSTVLLSANIAATALLGIWGLDWPRVLGVEPRLLHGIVAAAMPLLTVYAMFLLIYKFLPARRLPWRTAAVAALFAAAGFELVKLGFSWWVVNFADYANVFFAFTTVVLLVLSVYYAAVLFLIGGEVGQAFQLQRIMRRQREILH